MTSALIVHRSGPGVTVQDLGRTGHLAQGLSRGGVADTLALAEGAALLRAYHASADAPKRVDIAPDGVGKKKAVIKKLRFGKNTDFLQLDGGELDLDIFNRALAIMVARPLTDKALTDALDIAGRSNDGAQTAGRAPAQSFGCCVRYHRAQRHAVDHRIQVGDDQL